ncbi:hypothetical protein F4819DRAFT_482611 [Hypoxylon fuscum]|nr:hypothetical protein F4819DRAFT_482611 [Hypoxylon fuscum]
MDKIPAEVAFIIIDNVSKRDLKSLRFLSKYFNTMVSLSLFKQVFVSVHLMDLDVLVAIAKHPSLRFVVHEFIYSGVYFRKCLVTEHAGSFTFANRYYHTRWTEQEETRRSGEDLAIISSALTAMPNVRKITFTNHWLPVHESDRNGYEKAFGAIDKEITYTKSGGPLGRAYPPFVKKPKGFLLRVYDAGNHPIWIDHGFQVMCRALSISGRKIEDISMNYYTGYIGGPNPNTGFAAASFLSSPRAFQHAFATFKNLRKLSFCYQPALGDLNILQNGCIAKVLAAAINLEELNIDFNYCYPGARLSHFIGTSTWPCLHTLRLFQQDIQAAELVGRLSRHCNTLKALELSCIQLAGGTWLEVGLQLRNMGWRCLKSVTCEDVVEEDRTKRIWWLELENCILGHDFNQIYAVDDSSAHSDAETENHNDGQ